MRPEMLAPVWACWAGQRGWAFLGYKKSPEGHLIHHPMQWPAIGKPQVRHDIAEMEANGWDVYFTPGVFDGPAVSSNRIVTRNLLWADLDDKFDRERLRQFPPTFAWKTSPGSFQAIWQFLETRLNLYGQGGLNQALTYWLGADKGGWYGAKFLRVPGTTNHKPKNGPGGWNGGRVRQWHHSTFAPDDLPEGLGEPETFLPHTPRRYMCKPADTASVDVTAVLRRLDDVPRGRSLRHRIKHIELENDRSALRFNAVATLIEHGASAAEALAVALRYLDYDGEARRDVMSRIIPQVARP